MLKTCLARCGAALVLATLASCSSPSTQPTVVVYVALDEMYSRPILDAFEQETGIAVEAVYDTEAAKTTGLVNRLLSERNRPRADVFWNNEVMQTIKLQREGVIAPYASPAAEGLPKEHIDEDHYWHGFAARGRVVIYNTDLVDDPPTAIEDFLDPKWKGKAAIANPLFGTTATHAAALFALWGPDKAKQFFRDLRANDIAILSGNATVRDLVARGEYAAGLTDTDDANGAVEDGFPVKWLLVDRAEDELGALVMPNTVAVVDGAPHPEHAKALVDYLLSPGVEAQLAAMRSIQIPLRDDVPRPEAVPSLEGVPFMPVTFNECADAMEESVPFIQAEFQP